MLESPQCIEQYKSPGNDELSKKYYVGFFGEPGKTLVLTLNCSFDKGSLSNTQKQAVITSIEKKRKGKTTSLPETGDLYL